MEEFLNYKDLNNNLVSGYLQLLSNEISNKILLYKQIKLSDTTSLNKNSYDGSAGTINYRSETNYYISDSNYIIPLPKSAKKRSKTSGIQYHVGPMSKVKPSFFSCLALPPIVSFFS